MADPKPSSGPLALDSEVRAKLLHMFGLTTDQEAHDATDKRGMNQASRMSDTSGELRGGDAGGLRGAWVGAAEANRARAGVPSALYWEGDGLIAVHDDDAKRYPERTTLPGGGVVTVLPADAPPGKSRYVQAVEAAMAKAKARGQEYPEFEKED